MRWTGAWRPAPLLPWVGNSERLLADTLFVSLTYGTLPVGTPSLRVASSSAAAAPGCSATLDGDGPLKSGGGVLRAVDGPRALRLLAPNRDHSNHLFRAVLGMRFQGHRRLRSVVLRGVQVRAELAKQTR